MSLRLALHKLCEDSPYLMREAISAKQVAISMQALRGLAAPDEGGHQHAMREAISMQ